MKTPDAIKKGLECCTAPMLAHDSCPYKADRNPFEVICKDRVMEDALAYIRELEAQLAQVKAEYDAAVDDIELGVCCETCKHDNDDDEGAFCVGCVRVTGRGNWEWRGVKNNAE